MTAKQYKIYFQLQRAAQVLRKQADRALLDSGGITTAQAAVLRLTVDQKDVSQRQLANQLQQNESAMTAMITRLEDLGMLTKVRSSSDGRKWVLKVTKKGEKALSKIAKPFEEINQSLERAIGSNSLEAVANALSAVARMDEG